MQVRFGKYSAFNFTKHPPEVREFAVCWRAREGDEWTLACTGENEHELRIYAQGMAAGAAAHQQANPAPFGYSEQR